MLIFGKLLRRQRACRVEVVCPSVPQAIVVPCGCVVLWIRPSLWWCLGPSARFALNENDDARTYRACGLVETPTIWDIVIIIPDIHSQM